MRYFMILLLFAGSTQLLADKRHFVYTYEYNTLEPGEAEMEHYVTFSSPFSDSLKGTTSAKFNLEFEIGMTERFDFAIYQSFGQTPGGGLTYDGYKFRARYRLGEQNKYLLDPLLYFEYKGKPDFSEHELEFKIILAKNLGRFTFALNPTLEFELEDDKWEYSLHHKAGGHISINDVLSIGAELQLNDYGHYLGPTLSHGTNDYWVAVGTGFAITEITNNKPEFMVRMILGIGL